MKKLVLIYCILISFISLGQFSPVKNLSSSVDGANSVCSSDLDNDGDLDVLSTSNDDNKVVWFENLGNGEFSKQNIIAASPYNYVDVLTADFDNDGDQDVVCAATNGLEISIYENQGDGSFTWMDGFSVTAILSTVTGDIDGDNLIDIIVSSNALGGSFYWYRNLGNGSFSGSQLIAGTWNDPLSIACEDIDADGDFDIIVAESAQGAIMLHSNLGGGVFAPEQNLNASCPGVFDVKVYDVDGDSDLDILTLNDTISFIENLGLGMFGTSQDILTSGSIAFSMSDMDGDNDLDLVSSTFVNVSWLENNGSGIFGVEQTINPTAPLNTIYEVEAADLNGDGLGEAIFVNSASSIYFHDRIGYYENLGGGLFLYEKCISAHSAVVYNMKSGDLDGDGLMDIVYGHSGGLAWHKNMDNSEFSSRKSFGPLDTLIATDMVIEDLDNDGDNDIVYGAGSSFYGRLGWYENLGNGTFSNQNLIDDNLFGFSALVSDDFDGDGDIDLVGYWYYSGVRRLYYYENLGGGTFAPYSQIEPSSSLLNCITDLIKQDVDQDGDFDLVFSKACTAGIGWYENLGGNTFGSQQMIELTVSNPIDLFSTDLNSDGFEDILISFKSDYEIGWLESLGNGSYSPLQIIETVVWAEQIEAHDMDNDGDFDLIYGDIMNTNDDVVWQENFGNGVFGPQQIFASFAGNTISIQGADLNGDNDIDIITASSETSSVQWYENYLYHSSHVNGRIYVDINQNLVYDSLDFFIPQLGVYSNPQSDMTFSYSNGNYFMNFSDTLGTYSIQPQPLQYWSIATDSLSYTVTLDQNTPSMDSLDFGMYPDTTVNDLNTELIGGIPRCDTEVSYWINVQNIGTTFLSGIIHLHLDNLISYSSADIVPDSIVGQDIYWHYDTLYYFGTELIHVQVTMPDFNSMGDTLSSTLETTVDSSGVTLLAAYTELDQVLTCAYDPNDKISDPAGIDSLGFINIDQADLEYTIRFQNTGTDTALVVVIKDQLDNSLDWITLTHLASSHDVEIEMDQNGEVSFIFNNIMLPDSNVNEVASHGFIKYRIGILPNLTAGTSIYNSAEIYFDQNPAVITNTEINTLFSCEEILVNTSIQTIGCENENMNFTVSDTLSSTVYDWQINGVENYIGDEFNWIADTSGSFIANLNISNEFCTADSIFGITVYPGLAIQNISSVEICQGDSVLIFNEYQSLSGIYYDTLQSILGCDSILSGTLNLFAEIPVQSVGGALICIGDSALIFNQYQSIAGTYFDTLQSISGCDSIVSMFVNHSVVNGDLGADIIVCNQPSVTLSAIGAGSNYLWEDMSTGQQYNVSSSGFHSVLISNGLGCQKTDSVFVEFEVFEFSLGNDIEQCGNDTIVLATGVNATSYTWQDLSTNPTFNCVSTGIYWVELDSAVCSYTDTIIVTINDFPDINTSVINDTAITSVFNPNYVYNWYDCNSEDTIPFENNFEFYPSSNGSYALIANNFGCIDTSDCITIAVLNIESITLGEIKMYPNPANKSLTVEIQFGYEADGVIEIQNLEGKIVQSTRMLAGKVTTLSTANISSGIYYVVVQFNNEYYRTKHVIAH